jgi:pimeloyl-ACP methyl ester carboxylesterase
MSWEVSRADGGVIAVELAGDPGARPVLFCHGLADTRLSVHLFSPAARELGLRLIAPDRPGIGGTSPRRLSRLVDWVEDASLTLDALGIHSAAVLGVSAGGPYAAACAAQIPGVVNSLTLIAPLGPPGWPTRGMALEQRLSLHAAKHVPTAGGRILRGLAMVARRSPQLFLRLAGSALAEIDRQAINQTGIREAFLTGYTEAFRHGSWGVAQDLRVLTRPWGFQLRSITLPTSIHHGDADKTVPAQHARLMAETIPRAQLHLHAGHGHFSILAATRDVLAAVP